MTENEIIYSKHVKQRIEERQLEKQWIVDTVLNPDKTVVKADNEVHVFKRFIEKVVFNPIKKLVVTAHFDEKMTKSNKL